jgi:hypothetical protein
MTIEIPAIEEILSQFTYIVDRQDTPMGTKVLIRAIVPGTKVVTLVFDEDKVEELILRLRGIDLAIAKQVPDLSH